MQNDVSRHREGLKGYRGRNLIAHTVLAHKDSLTKMCVIISWKWNSGIGQGSWFRHKELSLYIIMTSVCMTLTLEFWPVYG